MQELKEVYTRLQGKKKERRELTKMFQDELKHNGEYQELVKEMKRLREKKTSIEDQAKASALSNVQQLDNLKNEIQSSTELLTDITLNLFLARESIELIDEDNSRLLPAFTVKFKKEEGESMQQQIQAERAESHADRMFAPFAIHNHVVNSEAAMADEK